MFKWRKYIPEDYSVISKWYVEHGWKEPPSDTILPNTGIIIEDDEGPVCVGFLYMTNSPLGFLEWIATRPGLGRKSIAVLEYFMEAIKAMVSGLKMAKVIHLSKDKYVKIYEKKLGFKAVEKATILIMEGV